MDSHVEYYEQVSVNCGHLTNENVGAVLFSIQIRASDNDKTVFLISVNILNSELQCVQVVQYYKLPFSIK
jgi:hypothetical protein